MTKNKNSGQRTPQSDKARDNPHKKKHQSSTSRLIYGMTSTSGQPEITTIPTTVELPLGISQATTVATSADDLQRTIFTTPHQTVPIVDNTTPPGAPNRERELHAETEILAAEENSPELTLKNFVSQHYEALTSLMREEARRRSGHNLHDRLNFGPERSQSRHHERECNERRTNVHDRLGTASNSQYSEDYEGNERQTNIHTRLGSRRVQDRLGRPRSPSVGSSRSGSRRVHDRLGRRPSPIESPSNSSSDRNRRKCRRKENLSSSDSSDNEDKETGHWKSRGKRHEEKDEDLSLPWRRQKFDAFTRRVSDYSDRKKRRMPTNVKTYDGTGDPDDHLKIFESAAAIENWPQPVWCHMFNSTLVGNARTWFNQLPRQSINGFEELRKAFRLNFTQQKKCAKNPVELARVKQRQGESTSAFMERFKDECIQIKACPEPKYLYLIKVKQLYAHSCKRT